MLAAKAHADSDGAWHLIHVTYERGGHLAYCGLELAGPDGTPRHPSVNPNVGASEVPMVDRCLRCARLGRWVESGSLF